MLPIKYDYLIFVVTKNEYMARIFRYIFITLLSSNILLGHAQKMTSEESLQDYWIDKYLSVSFPLRNIEISSSFGTRKDPFTGKRRIHGGLDLKAHYEKVLAMFDGSIINIGYDACSGNYIVIKHGDYTVSYCHLSKIWVRKGDIIYAGDPVGISGNTGRSTGPHLHITSRLRGRLEDPYNLLTYIRDVKLQCITALKVNEKTLLSPKDFFKRYAHAAMTQQKKYGIPASVILSQMAIESRWGSSTLAQAGFNYFGIKANRSWLNNGLPYSVHDDDLKGEKFCNFASPEASIEYHSKLLMSDRYKRCRRYSPTDFHNWLVSIKSAGYATARDYVQKCERIIMKYKLYLYDTEASRL